MDTWEPDFPVLIYHQGMQLPDKGTYFVVAGNGLFMHKDTGIVRAFIPVKNISFLDDLNTSTTVECHLPRIPARIVWQVKQFFTKVVELYRAESEINLYFNKETSDFLIHVPVQEVSHAGVRYARESLIHVSGMENYLRVGTIHSHCDFSAFHSGTDIGDEEDFDGLHVTFGDNHRDDFSITASVVVNGHRTSVDPNTVLEGITRTNERYLVEKHEPENWAATLEQWLGKVKSARSYNPSPSLFSRVCTPGEKVVWAEKNNFLTNVFGDGPFEVVGEEGNNISIKTSQGVTKLTKMLFKKE